ncbi:hypothetical protein K402DRAFT_177039 [Aulographum hederae CBS 113979]|uniref:DUF6697 domain-containing protein n=1 Tax=Aulographum hederae CBS 113979 TaxID=1176131 RepID=A0A6G1GQT0_9PEZI|nr:hypothetical protein K402DRAFT_177039 [Aulographum hederae CBS 113979]
MYSDAINNLCAAIEPENLTAQDRNDRLKTERRLRQAIDLPGKEILGILQRAEYNFDEALSLAVNDAMDSGNYNQLLFLQMQIAMVLTSEMQGKLNLVEAQAVLNTANWNYPAAVQIAFVNNPELQVAYDQAFAERIQDEQDAEPTFFGNDIGHFQDYVEDIDADARIANKLHNVYKRIQNPGLHFRLPINGDSRFLATGGHPDMEPLSVVAPGVSAEDLARAMRRMPLPSSASTVASRGFVRNARRARDSVVGSETQSSVAEQASIAGVSEAASSVAGDSSVAESSKAELSTIEEEGSIAEASESESIVLSEGGAENQSEVFGGVKLGQQEDDSASDTPTIQEPIPAVDILLPIQTMRSKYEAVGMIPGVWYPYSPGKHDPTIPDDNLPIMVTHSRLQPRIPNQRGAAGEILYISLDQPFAVPTAAPLFVEVLREKYKYYGDYKVAGTTNLSRKEIDGLSREIKGYIVYHIWNYRLLNPEYLRALHALFCHGMSFEEMDLENFEDPAVSRLIHLTDTDIRSALGSVSLRGTKELIGADSSYRTRQQGPSDFGSSGSSSHQRESTRGFSCGRELDAIQHQIVCGPDELTSSYKLFQGYPFSTFFQSLLLL